MTSEIRCDFFQLEMMCISISADDKIFILEGKWKSLFFQVLAALQTQKIQLKI